MTNIDPNNKVLPDWWLVPATKKTSFMARTTIDVYETDRQQLANKIGEFVFLNKDKMSVYKAMARNIAEKEYSSKAIKHKWGLLMDKLGV